MEVLQNLLPVHIPDWSMILLVIALAFIITFFAVPWMVTLAKSKGLFVMPNGRTSHFMATPYLGGVAVFIGFILTTITLGENRIESGLAYLIAGFIILLMVGLLDDLLCIKPLHKLIGQLGGVGIIVIAGDLRINEFYGIFGLHSIPYIPSVLFTIFVMIVIINGFNLIDGIDGLSSGVSILISVTFGTWFFISGSTGYAIMSFALAGSLAAFFYFNVFGRKNKIFLGDAGSLIVGLAVAILTIRFLNGQGFSIGKYAFYAIPSVASGILIIPLFDSLRIFILRISQGRSPFSADRQHIHHYLIDLGYSHLNSTLIIVSANLFFILVTLGLHHMSNIYLITFQFIMATFLSVFTSWVLNRKRNKRFFSRIFIKNQSKLNNETDEVLENGQNIPDQARNRPLKKI